MRGKTIARAGPDLQAGDRRHARCTLGHRLARLAGDGATIRAFDPEGMEQAGRCCPA